jgi:NADH dehydrogenase [ubiquinone] 1 alpha subcomplex assembly factor 6
LPPQAHLSKPWLLRLVSAREQYISNPPYPDLAALEAYAESTYSTLLYLTLSAIPLASLSADHLASHIGKASGIVAILRGIPLLAFPSPPNHHHHSNHAGLGPRDAPRNSTRQGAVTLPLDVMAQAGVREEDVLRLGPDAPGLRDAVFAVATRASDHLITARQMLQNLRSGKNAGHPYEHEGEDGHTYSPSHSSHETRAETEAAGARRGDGDSDTALRLQNAELETAFGALMPAVATGLWLEWLEKVDFDIFRPELRARDWKLPWRAYWAWRKRMF